MSEWEDFCESNGMDVGSEEDNDRFLDSLEGDDEGEAEPIFSTFQEASNWSKRNGGEVFTRTADGHHFMPKKNKPR